MFDVNVMGCIVVADSQQGHPIGKVVPVAVLILDNFIVLRNGIYEDADLILLFKVVSSREMLSCDSRASSKSR